MADLEDFFAKRDKKKSKKKFDSEDVAKVLEQKAKEKKKMETGKSNYSEGGRQSPGPGLPAQDDDEWIEAEELAPDYSDLKIKELILSDEEDEEGSQEGKEDQDGSNEGPWNKKTKAKKDEESPKEEASEETKEADESKPPADEVFTEEDGSKEKEEEKESAPARYVPPSMRNKQPEGAGTGAAGTGAGSPAPIKPASGGSAYVPPSRRAGGAATVAAAAPAPLSQKKKGAVPTLEDEDSFPSLS